MREKFVKFANLHGLSGHAYTMALWAFEAAYAAGMERAAEIVDSANNHDNPMTARDCADAIRAEIKEQS